MCGKLQEKEEPKEYEDFLSDHPEPLFFIDQEQKEIAEEHIEILKALIGKNLTAKEIHGLYWNHEKEKYQKTIKTVYRHLEALETAGLVKVCGHRKPHESRLTEKLFCRTANIFVLQEELQSKWWDSEKGTKYINKIILLVQELFNMPSKRSEAFAELMKEFIATREELTQELYHKTPESKAISELFTQENFYEIKSLSSVMATIGVILRKPDLCEQFRKVISK